MTSDTARQRDYLQKMLPEGIPAGAARALVGPNPLCESSTPFYMLLIGVLVAGAMCAFSYALFKESTNFGRRVKLATDLKAAGWTLYVSMKSCFFCKVQRFLFGPGVFELLDIVDCEANPEQNERCKAHPVCSQGTPCWHNKYTNATMLGLQRDFARLEMAALERR